MLIVQYSDNRVRIMSDAVFQNMKPLDVFMNFVIRGMSWEVNWGVVKENALSEEIFLADEVARSFREEGGSVHTLH